MASGFLSWANSSPWVVLFWNSEGDQPWDFFGRNDAKAETPGLWPPHVKSWLIGKDSDAGREWGQEEKGTTEDEMAAWHHWLDGRQCEWTPGVGDGQGGLACCDSWGCKESVTTEWLNWLIINQSRLNARARCHHLNFTVKHINFMTLIKFPSKGRLWAYSSQSVRQCNLKQCLTKITQFFLLLFESRLWNTCSRKR